MNGHHRTLRGTTYSFSKFIIEFVHLWVYILQKTSIFISKYEIAHSAFLSSEGKILEWTGKTWKNVCNVFEIKSFTIRGKFCWNWKGRISKESVGKSVSVVCITVCIGTRLQSKIGYLFKGYIGRLHWIHLFKAQAIFIRCFWWCQLNRNHRKYPRIGCSDIIYQCLSQNYQINIGKSLILCDFQTNRLNQYIKKKSICCTDWFSSKLTTYNIHVAIPTCNIFSFHALLLAQPVWTLFTWKLNEFHWEHSIKRRNIFKMLWIWIAYVKFFVEKI